MKRLLLLMLFGLVCGTAHAGSRTQILLFSGDTTTVGGVSEALPAGAISTVTVAGNTTLTSAPFSVDRAVSVQFRLWTIDSLSSTVTADSIGSDSVQVSADTLSWMTLATAGPGGQSAFAMTQTLIAGSDGTVCPIRYVETGGGVQWWVFSNGAAGRGLLRMNFPWMRLKVVTLNRFARSGLAATLASIHRLYVQANVYRED